MSRDFPDWAWLLLVIVSNVGAYRRGQRSMADHLVQEYPQLAYWRKLKGQ